ncbi:hypothetical protein TARUN_1933 [Trichoderma arundinaceum]|uniref:Alpha/beta hydrolase fold-3 domain-containing protein n=1 Tax=Trichoderma arundinaceum TaxID=490622 RepID=A0A395NWT7_TRIAR|nr:hypothetical protein TARUN_1933 [Trichoderma arundinaceum]
MFSSLVALRRRYFSVLRSVHPHIQKSVPVRCGSGGSVEVDLYNVDEFSPTNSLIVHLPPQPKGEGSVKQLPEFLYDWPVASINYRWGTERLNAASQENEFLDSLDWPAPVHDVAFAYQWISEALKPPNNERGNIYVCGSHLGAGLAMSLSLTESHPHKRFSVRGIAAYNGIYNWTMFLPGHRINRPKTAGDAIKASRLKNGNHRLDTLHQRLISLFEEPSNLFDPFASPSLFFHNPGLPVPQSFYKSTEFASIVGALKGQASTAAGASAMPRRSHFVFPPRASTLRIPETLLLHDEPSKPPPDESKTSKSKRGPKFKDKRHTFRTQANEIASLMRRSINLVEIKERAKWDEDVHFLAEEPQRRIQVVEAGPEREDYELNDFGQQAILDWLDGIHDRR